MPGPAFSLILLQDVLILSQMTYLSLSGLARDCCSFIFEKKTTSWLIIIINYIKNKKSLWFGFVLVSFAAVVWARHATLPPPTGGLKGVHGPGPKRGSMDQGSMFCPLPSYDCPRARCTRDTFCQTIAKTSANDLLDKGKFCQKGQIFKGANVLPQGHRAQRSQNIYHAKRPWKPGAGGGGGTPVYGLYRFVPRDRVWFLRFSVLK